MSDVEEREVEGEETELIITKYLSHQVEEEEREYTLRLQELYEFGLSLGILRDVLKAERGLWRLVWGGLALAALCMCIFQLSLVCIKYIDNPMNTRISYRVNTSMWFPTVTVCTYARVDGTRSKEMNISDQLLTYMLSTYKGMYLHYNTYNIRKDLASLEKEYQTFLSTQNSNFSLAAFFVENGFRCRDFLQACMFQGVEFDCCEDTIEILSESGKCFAIKIKAYTVQTIPGPSGGLKIYVYNWVSKYSKTMVNTNPDSGIQIHIVHPNETTYIGSKPLTIFPGTHAMVRLDAELRLLIPNNDLRRSCANNKTLQFYNSYSYEGCFTECVADMTMKTCGCVQIGSVPDYKQLKRGQICTPQVATACVQPLLQANNMGFLWDMYDITINCHCPLPCRQWLYSTIVSYSKVPNQGYLKVKQRRLEYRRNHKNESLMSWKEKSEELITADKDEIIVDIYYDKLVYTVTEEVPLIGYTLFLSQVGGQLSMWLGIRLVTLGHLSFYGTLVVLYMVPVWWHRFCRRVVRMKNEWVLDRERRRQLREQLRQQEDEEDSDDDDEEEMTSSSSSEESETESDEESSESEGGLTLRPVHPITPPPPHFLSPTDIPTSSRSLSPPF